MSDYEVHLEDDGTRVLIHLKENGVALPLTDVEEVNIKFSRKDRTTFDATASVVGDPANGDIECFSDDTFFTVKGDMEIQVFVKYQNGEWHTSKETFTVADNIVVSP